jgi:hypothetical protein
MILRVARDPHFQYGVDLLPKGNQEKGSLGERSGLIHAAGVVGALVSSIRHAPAA